MSDYWKQGTKIIEDALIDALRADPNDAPLPRSIDEAKIYYLRGKAAAYQHALEMMGWRPSS